MKVSVTVVATDQGPAVVDVARAVEDVGLAGLWLPDHSHMPVTRSRPYPLGGELPSRYKRNLELLIGLALAGAVTSRIRLGAGVLLPAQRDPIITAKALASIDQQTGGRLVVGAGYGWNDEELADHGVDPTRRRARLREHVLAMRALWTEEVAEFSGPNVTLARSWSWPKPAQCPLPVLLGGAASPVLCRHLAEFGQGWIPLGVRALERGIGPVRTSLSAADRNPDEFEVIPFLGSDSGERHWDRCRDAGASEIAIDLPHDAALVGHLEKLAGRVRAWL